MDAHPLDTLGFELIAFPAQPNARSLADLGFETVTDTVGASAKGAARKTARDPDFLYAALDTTASAAFSKESRMRFANATSSPGNPGDSRLLPVVQQMIVRPQAVGAEDAASGRKIVQPTDNPAINQALATDAMPAYKARLLQTIRHIPGARLAASRDAKNPARLAEKIAGQGQPAETVSDYGAAQIAVASREAKDAVVAAVKRHFPVLRQQDNFAFGDPEYRYRSYSLQVQMPNGSSEELQIVPQEVLEANRQEHHDYKKVRNAELSGRTADQARAAARAINDSAMEQFNSRNGVSNSPAERVVKGSVVKGARVRLASGALAKVVYVDPNMRIARVRTEDGRNVTVRHKDLRSS
jgi:hypothetical protein